MLSGPCMAVFVPIFLKMYLINLIFYFKSAMWTFSMYKVLETIVSTFLMLLLHSADISSQS